VASSLAIVLSLFLLLLVLGLLDARAAGRWYHRAVYLSVAVWGTGRVLELLWARGVSGVGAVMDAYPVLVGIVVGDFLDCEVSGQGCFWRRSQPEPDHPRGLSGAVLLVFTFWALALLGYASWANLRNYLLGALLALSLNRIARFWRRRSAS